MRGLKGSAQTGWIVGITANNLDPFRRKGLACGLSGITGYGANAPGGIVEECGGD